MYRSWPKWGGGRDKEIDQERVPGLAWHSVAAAGVSGARLLPLCGTVEDEAQMGEVAKGAKGVTADGNEASSDGRCGKPGPCS